MTCGSLVIVCYSFNWTGPPPAYFGPELNKHSTTKILTSWQNRFETEYRKHDNENDKLRSKCKKQSLIWVQAATVNLARHSLSHDRSPVFSSSWSSAEPQGTSLYWFPSISAHDVRLKSFHFNTECKKVSDQTLLRITFKDEAAVQWFRDFQWKVRCWHCLTNDSEMNIFWPPWWDLSSCLLLLIFNNLKSNTKIFPFGLV